MKIVYTAPNDETLLFDPSPEEMAEILLRTDYQYWLQGGNGEARLEVISEPGEAFAIDLEVITRDGLSLKRIAKEPSLCITQPELGWYFITWYSRIDGDLVPYDGSSLEPFVMGERGGDPFRIPRACLVTPAVAVEIDWAYLQGRQRSAAVQWRIWGEVNSSPH